MKLFKRIAWIAFVIICAGAIIYFVRRTGAPDFHWKTQVLQRGNIAVLVTATGPINPLQTVQVGTQVTGTVARLYADFNSVVKRGQVIALIDTTLLSASREDVAGARNKANTQLDEMKREYERTEKLYRSGVVPQLDYDQALANYQGAVSSVASLNAQVERARINLAYATIRAPINGVVISRNVDVGQTVVSSFNTPTLFTIANDLSRMEIYANVDEADIGQVKVGQPVWFTVDAYPDDEFSGSVRQIRLQPSIVQNVVNYTVIIEVANNDLRLLPGLTANINIKVKERKQILKVPVNALHFVPSPEYFKYAESLADSIRKKLIRAGVGDRKYIWIKKDTYLQPVEVETGLTDGSFTEVKGNLHEGDEIVVASEMQVASAAAPRSPFMPSFSRSGKNAR